VPIIVVVIRAKNQLGERAECWIYFTHLGFIFPKVFPCLLIIISHDPFSYILGENIPLGEYSFQLTLQFD
jgi:hypothetical protein